MAYTYLAMQVKTGKFMAELPMQVSGPRTKKLKDFGTASFTLYTRDESCPSDWAAVIDDGFCLLLVVDDNDKIVWSGNTTDHTINGDGTITVNCSTLEGQLAHLNVPDFKLIGVDQAAIFSALIDEFETECGLGLEKDITNTGTLAAIIVKESENKNFLACLQEQSTTLYPYEWTIDVEWTDNTFSAVRKVIRMKQHLGNDKATTNHIFELIVDEGDGDSGNVVDFNSVLASTPGNGATRVIATGDGTGALQIRSLLDDTTIDRATEAAGYLPSKYVQNFPGITSAVDIQTAAKVLAHNLFGGRRALTLTVKDSAATRITDINLGDYVQVDIVAPNMTVQNTMRVMSMQQENEFEFSPVIVDYGVDALFVPRPDDPTALGRLLGNITSNIAATTSSYNPVGTGFDIPTTNGGSFKLDAAAGTFGAYDSTGKALGGFDSTGAGFGGVGGGSGGGGQTGTVTNYDGPAELADVDINGISTRCENDSGMTLFVGDVVAVVDSKSGNGVPLIVSRKRIAASAQTPYFQYRISAGYPIHASELGLASGTAIPDHNSLLGLGPDAIAYDSSAGKSIYRPSSGQTDMISPPAGYQFLSEGIYLGGSNFAFHMFQSDANGHPYMFRRDTSAIGGWVLMNIHPATPGAMNDGDWQSTSFSHEPYGEPTLVTARITASTIQGPANSPFVPVDATVTMVDNATAQPMTKTYSVQMPVISAASGDAIASSAQVSSRVYANNGHVFMELRVNYISTNNSVAGSNTKLFYANLYGSSSSTLTQVDTSFYSYLGLDNDFFNGGQIRLSEDGELYAARLGLLHRRGITATGPGTSQFSNSTGRALAQRHLTTDTFFIASNEPIGSSYRYDSRSVLWWHQTTSSKTAPILGDSTIASNTGNSLNAYLSTPIQGPNGDVIVDINIKDVSSTFYTTERIVPGDLFNGQGATPPVTP